MMIKLKDILKESKNESVNEEKKNSNNLYLEFTDAVQDFNDRCIEIADKITKLKGDKVDGKILMKNVKKHLIPLVKLMNSWNRVQQRNPHLTTEGRYHAWRNDDSMTPKQKIGMAMRETRDSLKDLLKESSPGYENRQFGDPLPTLRDIAKKYQEKNGEIKEELLKEDDYATQYVDMVDDITKEVNRISVWIVKILNKQDKITGTKNARAYNQAVDKHFRKFIVDIKKITAKIED